jgi:hypothetical protein
MPNDDDLEELVREIVAAGNITADSPVLHIVETIQNYDPKSDLWNCLWDYTDRPDLYLLVEVLHDQQYMKEILLLHHMRDKHRNRPTLSCERCIELSRAAGMDLAELKEDRERRLAQNRKDRERRSAKENLRLVTRPEPPS